MTNDPQPDAPASAVRVTVFAVLPPPVTGMTVFTGCVADALASRVETRLLNLSAGEGRVTTAFRWRKFLRGLAAAARILTSSRRSGEWLLMPLNSGPAMLLNVLAATAARLRGVRIICHHHVYDYLNKRDRRVALINRLMGKHGVHVVHCELMEQHLRRRYAVSGRVVLLCPAFVGIGHKHDPQGGEHSLFTLGCLSNLTVAKGAVDAMRLFDELHARGRDVRMILAGPCSDPRLGRQIQDKVDAHPDRFDYRGPVYGEEKDAFFRDIDALAFPTKYASESWGLVVTEAMAFAKPTIANGLACIPWMIPSSAGVVIDPNKDYAQSAANSVERWMDSRDAYNAHCKGAAERLGELRTIAEQDWERLVGVVTSNQTDVDSAGRSPDLRAG